MIKMILGVLLLLLIGLVTSFLFFQSMTLTDVEEKIENDHPVVHQPVDSLYRQLQQDPAAFVLFDVREPDEFKVSHLENAIQIDPDLSRKDFTSAFSDAISGKRIVFYCSVGKRSSIALERFSEIMRGKSLSVVNLRGGIFRWYRSGYPVVNQQGPADAVHPYNAFWGQLLQESR